jgi:hypothetical protein
MDISILKAFFFWCTFINVALLVISFMFCAFAGDWIYRMHSKWYPISREAFNVAIYCFTGLFKIFVIVFSFVPWIALVIIE